MEPAIIITQIVGVLYVVISIGIFVNADAYRHMVEEYFESVALCYLGGILALLFGLLILTFHNTWSADWTSIITIIGWLATIKGVLLIVLPKFFLSLSKWMLHSGTRLKYAAIPSLLFGLFLTAKGFDLI